MAIVDALITSSILIYVLKRRKDAIKEGIGKEPCTVKEFLNHLFIKEW